MEASEKSESVKLCFNWLQKNIINFKLRLFIFVISALYIRMKNVRTPSKVSFQKTFVPTKES